MTRFVGLDVSQKMTAICVVDNAGMAGPVSHNSRTNQHFGASVPQFQNKSAFWSAGMREMTFAYGSRPEQ
jgi:hypothetical protein